MVWLARKGSRLEIIKTSNADNPLSTGARPLIGCDVWEHAYYIDYRNRRLDFLNAYLDHLVNWETAARLYATDA
jgi:Fe-Mn family superoxide dismutase